MKIFNKFTGAEIIDVDAKTIEQAIIFCVTNKICLIGANLSNANLYGADLYGADLHGANLTNADLHGANLTNANLYGADLYGADLTNAHLTNANLTNANLTNANLTNADLTNAKLTNANLTNAKFNRAIGNMSEVFSLQLETWKIVFTNKMLFIGCKSYEIERWNTFNDEQIKKMHPLAYKWWEKWKDHIFKTISLCLQDK